MTPTWMPRRVQATTISYPQRHIIDGTGNPGITADVAVSGDRLAAIGDLREAHAKREIDARRIVAPASLTCRPVRSLSLDRQSSLSKLSQGITRKSPAKAVPSLRKMKDRRASKPFLTTTNSPSTGPPRRLFSPPRKARHTSTSAPMLLRRSCEAVIGDDNRAPTPPSSIR